MPTNQNSTNTNNTSYDPMQDNPKHRRTGNPEIDVLYDILDELKNDRGRIRRAPVESQSSVASNSKWEFSRRDSGYKSRGDLVEDFENGIKDELLSDIKKGIQNGINQFSKEFGFDIRNIGHEAGKLVGGKIKDAIKNSPLAQSLGAELKKKGMNLLDSAAKSTKGGEDIKNGLINVWKAYKSGSKGGGGFDISSVLKSGGQGGGSSLISGLAKSGGGKVGTDAFAKFAIKIGKNGGAWGLLIAGIVITLYKVLKPAVEGLANLLSKLGKSFTKSEDLRKKRMENAQKRLEVDMQWIAEQPFKILEEATKKWEDAWDSNLRTIGQTQGYDKEGVYALYEGYAERLREDNLNSVINATDIVDKLSSVLETGLSGAVAEEFAYVATKLNAAIPGQDFFGYAETYASIAANAISQGQTQTEALAAANAQLEQFASNLLYSSRELAGGFSTGLKNGSSLFKDAVEIAQAAKTYNADAISGTLTSVSAIIGAVAPDMADSLVSNIVQAAVGGNSSQIVALRSLAGINAGNTAFLRALAEDPQTVFSTLFTNLANMQNMSPANYMEVAEGLADVFGIDKNAFARVDFNYLAQAISSMEVNSKSLNDNLHLLESGQTTTSAEQLKAQEINRVILDEGLAYIIDSEAGRMVQEHMWEEQRANALMENEYAVSLQGAALQFLEGIRKSISTLINFLNPVGFIAKGITNMTEVIADSIGNEQDLREILRLGAVGGDAKAFDNLTTRGKDLNLTSSLVTMMGGTRRTAGLNQFLKDTRTDLNKSAQYAAAVLGWLPVTSDQFNVAYDAYSMNNLLRDTGIAKYSEGKSVYKDTRYSWGTVGKSIAKAIQETPVNDSKIEAVARETANATQKAQSTSNKKFQEFLDTAEEASKTMSYDWWVKSAKNFGISDFAEALKNYGRTEEEIKAYFEDNRAQEGAKQEVARKEDEQLFRDENRTFWDYTNGNGVFQTAIWFPFFGDGQKYDTRMNAVDYALSDIQSRIGTTEKHTVISGLEEISKKLGDDTNYTVISVLTEINSNVANTFVSTSSVFQRCLKDWTRYIASKENYSSGILKSTAWSELKQAEGDRQNETLLALANAMNVFSADELKKLDPQLQTNVLLGEIVVILQSIMQQNNTQFGGLSLPDTLSALGFGVTSQT